MATQLHGWRRWLRWLRRCVVGALGLAVVLVAAAAIVIHTDFGREWVRAQLEARLQAMFPGGATIGRLEGSPFGTVVVRDVMLRGPDGRRLLSVKTLRAELELTSLLSRHLRITELTVDDVDVELVRDGRGELVIGRLIPNTAWAIDVPEVHVHRAHASVDAGVQRLDFDDVELSGSLRAARGKPVEVTVVVEGRIRQRGVTFRAEASLRSSDDVVEIPYATVRLGGLRVAARAVRVTPVTPTRAATYAGVVSVRAPRTAVAQLLPDRGLPVDLAATIEVSPRPTTTQVRLDATADGQVVVATVDVDVAALRARGWLAAGRLDLGSVTGDRVRGTGTSVAVFDLVSAGPWPTWPTGTVMIHAAGDLDDTPNPSVAIAATSRDPGVVSTVVGITGGGLSASAAGELRRVGDTLALTNGTMVARSRGVVGARGEPVFRGDVVLEATANGQLFPKLDVAATGTVAGDHLRWAGLAIEALHLGFDARGVPDRPSGHATVRASGVARGGAPWLVEGSALVGLARADEASVVIELQHHRVHAGRSDWTGSTGHLEIGRTQIALRDFVTARTGGRDRIAARGVFQRGGPHAGDLTATVDATALALDILGIAARSTLDAHLALSRTSRRLTAAAVVRTTAPGLGTARVDADLDAPLELTDVAAWRTLGRKAIRTGQVTLEGVELDQLAALVGLPGAYQGRLDGGLQISPAGIRGQLWVRDAIVPALREHGAISAELELSQSAPNELTSTVKARIGRIGGIEGRAIVAIPERVFDPSTWTRGAIKAASVRVADVALETSMLDRPGTLANLRGRVTLVAELAEAARSARLAVTVRQLRGSLIAQPLDVELAATIGEGKALANVTLRSAAGTLIDARGTIGITLAGLLKHPSRLLAAPLELTATLPRVPAPRLLAVFGRSDVTSGTVDGTLAIAGTLGQPTLRAHLAAADLRLQHRPGRRAVDATTNLLVDATWEHAAGTLVVDGTQRSGTLHLVAAGSPWALGDATVTLVATTFDLASLLAFGSGRVAASAGQLDGTLSVTGLTPGSMRLAGELHLSRARVPISPTVGTLRGAAIDLVVRGRDARLTVDGRLGGGTVKGSGTIVLDGASFGRGDVTLQLRRITPIGILEPKIDADITATLRRDDLTWVTDIAVTNGRITVPAGHGTALKPIGAPSDMRFRSDEASGTGQPAPPGPHGPTLVANITVHPLRVESVDLRSVVSGMVTVTADGPTLGIVGRIDADGGDFDLFGRRYRVERATVNFDGSTDPLVDVRITHDFADVTTVTVVQGRLSKPELLMSSDPSTYSQGELLGFLIGGEPHGDPSTGSLKDSATAVGTSVVAGQLASYVRMALPIDLDVVRYEAATSTSSGAITVGSWITHRLFLGYRSHPGARLDENSSEGRLEYWLSRRLVVEGAGGDRGYGGLDLLWRKRY